MKYFSDSLFRTASGLLIMMSVACASGSREPSPRALTVIEAHFLNRTELDPIEGVWLREDRLCEIAVFKPPSGMSQEYAYVGVVTKDCYYGKLADTDHEYRERTDVSFTGTELLSIRGVDPDGRYYPAWHHSPGGDYQCELYIARGILHVTGSVNWSFVRVYPDEEH
jgi:hypothetical protein